MLRSTELIVFGASCRLVELEVYFYSDVHPDPFTHRHELQRTNGRWYFHRMGNSGKAALAYKNGSFRGLDISIGGECEWGGVLIRSIETPKEIIDGPCLCVNFILDASGMDSLNALDNLVSSSSVWAPENPLRLQTTDDNQKEVYRTARVGLTLKKSFLGSTHAQFLLSRYRFLTEPHRLRKGRVHLIAAMVADGRSKEEIMQRTGAQLRTVEKYAGLIREGSNRDLEEFRNVSIGAREICLLHGVLDPEVKNN